MDVKFGRGRKHHFRGIESQLQVIIVKSSVLFRVERFEQGRCKIAVRTHTWLLNVKITVDLTSL
jgi:hypothetical protein